MVLMREVLISSILYIPNGNCSYINLPHLNSCHNFFPFPRAACHQTIQCSTTLRAKSIQSVCGQKPASVQPTRNEWGPLQFPAWPTDCKCSGDSQWTGPTLLIRVIYSRRTRHWAEPTRMPRWCRQELRPTYWPARASHCCRPRGARSTTIAIARK